MKNSRLVGLALAGLLPVAGALVLTFSARCAGQSSESLKPGTSGFDKSKIFGRDTLSEAAKNFRSNAVSRWLKPRPLSSSGPISSM